MDQYFTVQEVSARTKLSAFTIRRHIKSGSLRAVNIGGRYRISEQAVDQFLKRHAHSPVVTDTYAPLHSRRALLKAERARSSSSGQDNHSVEETQES